MTSAINTGSIDSNYPTPGINNSSQGFRDNFASAKNNLDIASREITDLQNKVILKSALTGITLNNDMNNTVISNAQTSGFRHSTYNLGNNLSSTVTVDITQGDVQYGTITGDTQLQIMKWPPDGTQGNVQVILTVDSTTANISLPTQTIQLSAVTLDRYKDGNLTVPVVGDVIHLQFTSIDCGASITVEPVNLPRKTTQVLSDTVFPNNPIQGEIRFVATSDTTGQFHGWNGSSWVVLG